MFGFGRSVGQTLFDQFYGKTDLLSRLVVESEGIPFLRNPRQERAYRIAMLAKIMTLIRKLQMPAGGSHKAMIRDLNRAFTKKDYLRICEFVFYLGWCQNPDEARQQGVRSVAWSWWFGRPKIRYRSGRSPLLTAGALAAGYVAGQKIVQR